MKVIDSFLNILRNPPRDQMPEILKTWDGAPFFPDLTPVDFAYARARLTAFRSSNEWLTVFEVFGFQFEGGLCMIDIKAYGDKVSRSKHSFSVGTVTPPKGRPNFPYFDYDDEGKILLDPLNFVLEVKGKRHHFTPTVEEYRRLGIDLNHMVLKQFDPIIKVIRLLAYAIPDEVFLSDAELLEHLGRPRNLPRFLQLYDWRHPDYRLKEKLSDSPCLRTLARALAQSNPKLYECPGDLVNTHWSNWPEWTA